MEAVSTALDSLAGFLWGKYSITLWLIVAGGFFFTIYSRGIPFRYFGHAFAIIRGKYDDPNDPGQINHFRALCAALSGTVGMGNIAGVAVAVGTAGPGALFWMWICAILGMSTKFFTCTLTILYRGKDDRGEVQGGPMYYIEEGMGAKWRPLAIFFAVCGLFGALPLFQSNQLASLVQQLVFDPLAIFQGEHKLWGGLLTGLITAALVGGVIFGGIKRIGLFASRMVPAMVILYVGAGLILVLTDAAQLPATFALIFQDAFTGKAMAGGTFWGVFLWGIRRGAFSNEAGLGTEALAHGAAKTRQPIREGLVAMTGPFFDTLIICTITGLLIINSGAWQDSGLEGVLLTHHVFQEGLPGGSFILLLCVLCFSFTSMVAYSYYVTKCANYLFGFRSEKWLSCFYLLWIIVAAVVNMGLVL
ncbi:MAG: amino acid carrier protein, partial [Verrucomicrobiota bacterium]